MDCYEVQLQFSQSRKDFVENLTSNLTCKESLEKCLQLLMLLVITRYVFITLNSISAVIEVASNNLYFSEHLIKDWSSSNKALDSPLVKIIFLRVSLTGVTCLVVSCSKRFRAASLGDLLGVTTGGINAPLVFFIDAMNSFTWCLKMVYPLAWECNRNI